MEKHPFFTIGIPVYNVEKYLARCLDSVLCQSFDDFEILAVDDGSPDNSIDILNEYAAKDSRIRIIRKENCGVSAARNTIITFAKGKYLFFLDSDDTMCENALFNAYAYITENNFPDILQTGYKKVIGDKVINCSCEQPDKKYFDEGVTKDDRIVMLWADKKIRDQIYCRFINTEFMQRSGIAFTVNLRAQEDNEFIFSLYRYADTVAFGEFAACNYFKQRENSVSTVWSCRSVASVFNRWHSFFYGDYRYFNLTKAGMEAFEKGKLDFLMQIRYGIIGLPLYRTEEEIEVFISLLENYFERDIRKLPVGRTSHAPAYLMYKLIGIRKTVALLKIATKILKKK